MTVTLTTSQHIAATTYTLTVTGVQDVAGNSISAGTQATYIYGTQKLKRCLLWNKLGSTREVLASEIGPDAEIVEDNGNIAYPSAMSAAPLS